MNKTENFRLLNAVDIDKIISAQNQNSPARKDSDVVDMANQTYIDSEEPITVDLTGKFFGGFDILGHIIKNSIISHASVHDISFEHCTLENVDFSKTILEAVRFSFCEFKNCTFEGACFADVSFKGCDIDSVTLQTLEEFEFSPHHISPFMLWWD